MRYMVTHLCQMRSTAQTFPISGPAETYEYDSTGEALNHYNIMFTKCIGDASGRDKLSVDYNTSMAHVSYVDSENEPETGNKRFITHTFIMTPIYGKVEHTAKPTLKKDDPYPVDGIVWEEDPMQDDI